MALDRSAGTGHVLDEANATVMAGVDRCLDAIRDNDLILATGHLDKRETAALVRRAHARGLKRIITTCSRCGMHCKVASSLIVTTERRSNQGRHHVPLRP